MPLQLLYIDWFQFIDTLNALWSIGTWFLSWLLRPVVWKLLGDTFDLFSSHLYFLICCCFTHLIFTVIFFFLINWVNLLYQKLIIILTLRACKNKPKCIMGIFRKGTRLVLSPNVWVYSTQTLCIDFKQNFRNNSE